MALARIRIVLMAILYQQPWYLIKLIPALLQATTHSLLQMHPQAVRGIPRLWLRNHNDWLLQPQLFNNQHVDLLTVLFG
jgi:hypothetical protein